MMKLLCSVKISAGGEAVPTLLPKIILENSKSFNINNIHFDNGYGPAECMVATYHRCTTEDVQNTQYATIPIGKPLPNYSIYVLDNNLNRVGIDCEGELYIGGDGVFSGYWREPILTSKALINIPSLSKTPLYKTGDLVKMNADGNLRFIGRVDFQVKIRGTIQYTKIY